MLEFLSVLFGGLIIVALAYVAYFIGWVVGRGIGTIDGYRLRYREKQAKKEEASSPK